MAELMERMRDDDVKETAIKDKLISKYVCLRMEALGKKAHQKLADIHRVSQSVRMLGRMVLAAQKRVKGVTLNDLIDPRQFDLVVDIAKSLSVDKDTPALNVGRLIGHLLGYVALTKTGMALRENKEKAVQAANNFKKLHEGEWNYRVNSVAVKMINKEKRSKVPVIPLTEGLKVFRTYVMKNMRDLACKVHGSHEPADWTEQAKKVMARLIMFNKRSRAEVRDRTVDEYLKRPKWQ